MPVLLILSSFTQWLKLNDPTLPNGWSEKHSHSPFSTLALDFLQLLQKFFFQHATTLRVWLLITCIVRVLNNESAAITTVLGHTHKSKYRFAAVISMVWNSSQEIRLCWQANSPAVTLQKDYVAVCTVQHAWNSSFVGYNLYTVQDTKQHVSPACENNKSKTTTYLLASF